LNSLPDGIGCTRFPLLNLNVQAKRGCAVMFCNVLDSGDIDPRLLHEGCPIEGNLQKYGVNVSI
jgi:hypothetical protein